MKYVSILRGINVGGHRKILMADLKLLFEGLDFTDIQTYIQSGNILFQSSSKASIETHSKRISNAIQDKYTFNIPVVIIPANEFSNIVNNNPFFNEKDTSRLYVTFLSNIPDSKFVEDLNSKSFAPDIFKIIANKIYLNLQNKYHKTKLSNNYFERNLHIVATTRNWKTVLKIKTLNSISK